MVGWRGQQEGRVGWRVLACCAAETSFACAAFADTTCSSPLFEASMLAVRWPMSLNCDIDAITLAASTGVAN